MPEGDSVYKLARRLDSSLRGQRLVRGELRVPAHATDDLAGRTVREHATYGKHLLTRFDGDLTLHTHLRLDGSWTVVQPGRRLPASVLPDVRVLLGCSNGTTAYGISLPVVELLHSGAEGEVIGHLGPDPLRPDWDAAVAVARLAADPTRALAARALRHSALTPGAYQVTTGSSRRGEDHWVAGRANEPCRRCRTPIRVVAEVAGDPDRRRTWWCPRCQPGPGPDR